MDRDNIIASLTERQMEEDLTKAVYPETRLSNEEMTLLLFKRHCDFDLDAQG